jgi:uncharacterized membrane protein
MSEWPKELQVLILAATPVSELRGAIPLALYYEMSPLAAYLWSVLGNMLPTPFLLMGLGWMANFCSRWPWVKKIIDGWFARVQRQNTSLVERWGTLALVFFVAIPLPMTGAWSGAAIAYLFKMPWGRALAAIGVGVLIAGLLILGGALGVIYWLNL